MKEINLISVKRYIKIKTKIEKLQIEQNFLKETIIEDMKVRGINIYKDKKYEVFFKKIKKVSWNIEKAVKYFKDIKKEKCIEYKINNDIVETLEHLKIIKTKDLNKIRKIKYDSERLYVQKK